MTRLAIFCLAIALGQAAGSANAADKAFQGNYAKARKNVTVPAGAAYDNKLGQAMQANPEYQRRFKDCAKRYPDKQAVHGYFRFSTATSYKVVLEPSSPFSGCLARALEGHRVPPPPSLPYFNPFDMIASPARK